MVEIEIEKVQEFYNHMVNELKIDKKIAGSVVYYLQETLPVFADHYEQCDECGEFFDSWSEGIYGDNIGHICESCRDQYEECVMCEEHFKSPDKPEDEHFVLNYEDAEGQGLKPGLYTARSFPYWSSDMISQTLYHWAISKIWKL